MARFALDVARFVQVSKLRGELVLRKLAFDALSGLIRRSPVRTGRYRASHRIGINAPDLSTGRAPEPASIPKKYSAPKPHETNQGLAALALQPPKLGDSIYITMSLPYGEKLEGGSSPQAKSGIYGPTFLELKGKVDKAIAAAVREKPNA